MVVVPMGTQYGAQAQPMLCKESQHWCCVTRVDDDRQCAVVYGPDVVVVEGRNGGYVVHGLYESDAMPDCRLSARTLNEWLLSPQGDYVLSREQAYYDKTVADIFGFNALQLGLREHAFLRNSRMPVRLYGDQTVMADVRFCYDELPFACESIDLLIMPHVLEFSDNPHQILREVERVLMPEGNLLISGFNPYSLWGLRRKLSSKQGYPWCGEFIALRRLKDWLALLGFVVMEGRFTAYAPPFNRAATLARCHFMEVAGDHRCAGSGGVYFLHAIKRVPGMRLIQPKWNKKLVGNLLPATPKMNNNKSHNEISK